uniref:Uncharacterized protein n=1 Tax=Ditylenchus dipsaci TaxID=166011 RepID=A0A915EUK7_9BILA
MTVLEFEVLPENCLKNDHLELLLGTPINQVIVALQNASRIIKNVELVYCNKEPFEKDITITLKNDGIRLYFEPKAQILKLIEVFDFKNVTLHYCNTVFSSPSEEANVSKVENCLELLILESTTRNKRSKEPSSTIQPSYAHGLSSLNFSNSSLPLLERMTIFCGSSPNEMRIPEVPVSVHCGNIFLIGIESINEEGKIAGLRVVFLSEDDSVSAARKTSEMTRVERFIRFGDTEQSVLSSLGAPAKIFYKSDEKMLIQRGSSSENLKNVDRPDFFFNYFSLGLVG